MFQRKEEYVALIGKEARPGGLLATPLIVTQISSRHPGISPNADPPWLPTAAMIKEVDLLRKLWSFSGQHCPYMSTLCMLARNTYLQGHVAIDTEIKAQALALEESACCQVLCLSVPTKYLCLPTPSPYD